MKPTRVFLFVLVLLGVAAISVAARAELIVPAAKDAAWFAKARASYPTDVCVVSGEKLGGDMGAPVDFIDRVPGKPDRLIRFCCKGCVKDFKKDPEKYLKILDAAAAKKNASAPAK